MANSKKKPFPTILPPEGLTPEFLEELRTGDWEEQTITPEELMRLSQTIRNVLDILAQDLLDEACEIILYEQNGPKN